MARKFFSALIGGVVAFALSAFFVFVLGANTKVTVFGADLTLVFFENFFICMASSLVVEWVLRSEIEDALIDLIASVVVSFVLVLFSSKIVTNWLSTTKMWTAVRVYFLFAMVAVIFAAFFSTRICEKIKNN